MISFTVTTHSISLPLESFTFSRFPIYKPPFEVIRHAKKNIVSVNDLSLKNVKKEPKPSPKKTPKASKKPSPKEPIKIVEKPVAKSVKSKEQLKSKPVIAKSSAALARRLSTKEKR